MLVCLQNNVEHFSCFLARLVDQSLPNNQKSWEGCFYYLIKVGTVLPRFESKHATKGEETLQACEYGGGIVGVEQLKGDVYECRPFLWKIVV